MTSRASHRQGQTGQPGVISTGNVVSGGDCQGCGTTSTDTQGMLSQGVDFCWQGMTTMYLQPEGVSLPGRVTQTLRAEIALPADGNKDLWTPHHRSTCPGLLPCAQEHAEHGRVSLRVSFSKTPPATRLPRCSPSGQAVEILRTETRAQWDSLAVQEGSKDVPALEGLALGHSPG